MDLESKKNGVSRCNKTRNFWFKFLL